MEVVWIGITQEISGELYYKLIDFAVGKFPIFVFVVDWDRKRLQETVEKVIKELTPHLIKRFYSREWPGTELLNLEVEVFHFNLNQESANILKKYTSSLYQWTHPILPEDMSIMRNSTQPWLCNTAHDDMATFYMSSAEKAELLKTIPELSSYLGEEGKPLAYY